MSGLLPLLGGLLPLLAALVARSVHLLRLVSPMPTHAKFFLHSSMGRKYNLSLNRKTDLLMAL